MSKPLADVIYEAGPRADPAPIAAAIRSAGYKSPEEIAAALDAEEARWVRVSDESSEGVYAVLNLRATLLGTEP